MIVSKGSMNKKDYGFSNGVVCFKVFKKLIEIWINKTMKINR